MTRARDVANLIGSGNYSSTTFTATAGQTVFSIAHTQNFVQVFMNGLLLDLTADYTSNGSAVTLTSGAAVGDEIEVVAYNTFSVGDAIPASGGTFTGNVQFDGSFTSKGIDDNADATAITIDSSENVKLETGNLQIKTTGQIEDNGTRLLCRSTGDASGLRFDGASYTPFKNGSVANGTVDLGYGSGRYKDLYLSGGAYIGGTAAANHLDDYETGSFQMSVSGVSSGALGYGAYIKVGNVCHFNWYSGIMSVTSTPTPLLTGLPFTCVALTGSAYPSVIFSHNTWTSNVSTGYVNIGTTNIYPTANNSSGGASTSTGSKYVMCSGSYQVA